MHTKSIRYSYMKTLIQHGPNEPITEPMWTAMDVQTRYPAVDKELAEGSAPNTLEFLHDFYTREFDRITPNIKDDAYVVLHDGFQMKVWKEFLTQPQFVGKVVLDTHQYLMIAEALGCEQTLEAYTKYIRENYAKDIEEVQAYVPVVCGEWCLFNSLAVGMDTKGGQSVLNGMDFTENAGISAEEKKAIYEVIAKEQLEAWRKGSGYFYWSYKLLDKVNEKHWKGWDCWDLGKSVDEGWFTET